MSRVFAVPLPLVLACVQQAKAPAAPVASSGEAPAAGAPAAPFAAPAASAASADNREWVLGQGDLALPDGTLVRWGSNEEQGFPGEHVEFVRPDNSSYSYLEPGDAELIQNHWMLSRDAGDGRARVRSWAPRTLDFATGRTAALRLGDRATSGAWAIEWVAVEPGTGGLTGTRAMTVRSTLLGKDTAYWQYDGKLPARHEFASMQGLYDFEVVITAAAFGREANDSSLVLSGHEVDEATPSAYGASLDPGLYVFPDGLRVGFRKGGMWVTTTHDCTYHETFGATAAKGPGYQEEFVDISDTRSAFAFTRIFDLRAGKLVVSL